MESAYGVGVRNRYDILIDEDADPNDVIEVTLKEQEEKKKKKDVEFTKIKPFPKKTGKENQEKPEIEKAQRPKRNDDLSTKRGRSDRTVRFASFPREERNNRRNEIEERPSTFETTARETAPRLEGGGERGRGGRGMRGGRGRGRGRGRGFGQDGFDSRGKREFDRMSGSEKSDGADVSFDLDNSHNNSDLKHDDSGLDGDTVKEDVSEEDGNKSGLPEEITFDEWKAQQGERQKPTFNIRKAGEGENANWKKGYSVLSKKVEEEDSDSEYDDDWIPHGRQKQVVNINIEFTNPRKLRRARRDVSKQSAPRVDDEKDFPCLL